MANEIVTEVKLELDQFRQDLKAAQKSGEDSAKAIGEGLGHKIEEGFAKPFEGLKEKFLEIGAEILAAFTFEKAIEKAIELEQSVNNLNAGLAINGAYSEEASAHFVEYAESLSQVTTASGQAIIQGGALLTTLGQLSGPVLDKATKASLDFSAVLGGDTSKAFSLVAKAAEGHTEILKRYGIQITNTGNKAYDFNSTLNQLEMRFGGLAEAQTNTFGGALKQTENSFEKLLETVGKLVTQSPLLLDLLKKLSKAFSDASEFISDWAEGRDVIQELGVAIIQFANIVNQYLVAPMELAWNILKTGVLAIGTVLGELVSVFAEVGQAIWTYLTKPLVDFIGNGLGKLISLVDKDLGQSLANFVQSATTSVVQGYGTIADVADEFTKDLATATADSAGKVFDFNVTDAVQSFLQKSQEFLEQVRPGIKSGVEGLKKTVSEVSLWDSFAAGFNQAVADAQSSSKKMQEVFSQLGKVLEQSLGNALSKGFESMGSALVQGKNAFAAFGAAMLSVLGQVLVQFGAAFIALGVARAIASYGLDPSAYALIAAGAGLSLLGGVLEAVGGAASSSPATGAVAPSTGGGVAANGGSLAATDNSAVDQVQSSERGQIGTKVEVNVLGNVFDRKETGLQLADIINETFGSSGVTYAT